MAELEVRHAGQWKALATEAESLERQAGVAAKRRAAAKMQACRGVVDARHSQPSLPVY
jgi:hypothetical protein